MTFSLERALSQRRQSQETSWPQNAAVIYWYYLNNLMTALLAWFMGHLCHISEFKHDKPSRMAQWSFLIIMFPDGFMAKRLARRGNVNARFINRYDMCHWKIANRQAESLPEIYLYASAIDFDLRLPKLYLIGYLPIPGKENEKDTTVLRQNVSYKTILGD